MRHLRIGMGRPARQLLRRERGEFLSATDRKSCFTMPNTAAAVPSPYPENAHGINLLELAISNDAYILPL